jgi:hypothetical protein
VRQCFLGYCGVFAAATALAQAQDPDPLPVDLSWEGPEGCTGTSQILAEIRQMLPDRRLLANASHIVVAVEIVADDDGKWSIGVATVSGELAGQRQLRANSCDDARRAVALLVALMLDPQANPDGSAPPKTKSEPELAPAAPVPSATPHRERSASASRATFATPLEARAPRTPLRAVLGAYLVADNGTLPSLDVGATVLFGVRARQWELALRASGWAARNMDYVGESGMGVNLRLYDANLAICGNLAQKGQGTLQLCAGPRVYVFHAASHGVASPGSVTEVAWGAFGELALGYRVAHGARLRLGLEALVPLQRPRFAIYDLGFVFQPRRLAERISLGPEFDF